MSKTESENLSSGDADTVEANTAQEISQPQSQWGKWLFRVTLTLGLIFMWWLVIYDHGVVTQH